MRVRIRARSARVMVLREEKVAIVVMFVLCVVLVGGGCKEKGEVVVGGWLSCVQRCSGVVVGLRKAGKFVKKEKRKEK